MLKNINFKKVIIFFITLFILLFIYLIKVYITYDPKKLVEEVNYSKVVLDRKGEILSVFLNNEEEFHIKYLLINMNYLPAYNVSVAPKCSFNIIGRRSSLISNCFHYFSRKT